MKHADHLRDLRNVPLANIAIESGVGEHIAHIRNVGNVPLADVPCEWTAVEQPTHVRDVRDVDEIQVAVRTFCFNGLLDEFKEVFLVLGNDHRIYSLLFPNFTLVIGPATKLNM